MTGEAPRTVTTASGTTYTSLPVVDADRDPVSVGTSAPHGDAVYVITPYPREASGVLRALGVQVGHREIAALADGLADGAVLCGVQHAEDIEAWQAPHSARTRLNRLLRDKERETGRRWALLRCWQHRGPCPTNDTTTSEEADRG